MNKLEVFSPFDRRKIGEVRKITSDELENIIESSHKVFKDRKKWLTIPERISILEKLVSLIKRDEAILAVQIAKEGGKPLIDAKIEVSRAIDGIKIAMGSIPYVFKGEEITMGLGSASIGKRAFTIIEPLGVALAVSAFNHPLNLLVHQAVPAIATGCPVIIKPSSQTPLTAKIFVSLVHEAGLPKEWCSLCIADREVSEKLISDKRISFLSFIGSSTVGFGFLSKIHPGTRFSFEHGGVAPAIIDKEIENIDTVVTSLLKGSFYHAGQVCISTQRIYVHKSLLEKFKTKFVEGAKKLKVGNPEDEKTEVGPIITIKELDRIDSWVKEAIEEGAVLLCGGEKLSETLYKPTVLLNPSENSKVTTKEVFGPVVSIYEYEDLSDVIYRANNNNFAFQTAIFSDNIHNINKLTEELDASAVIVNEHTAFRVDHMPFAGRREAGFGIGGIEYTMKDMTAHKMIIIKR